jgi:hypothetical protein
MKRALQYASTFEPARLRAAWVAAIALAGTLGYAIPTGVDSRVVAVIGALAVIVPIVQGEVTRAAVYAPASVVTVADPVAQVQPQDTTVDVAVNASAPVDQTLAPADLPLPEGGAV